MSLKKLISYINAENESDESVIKKAIAYEQTGADELFIYNYSMLEKEKDEFLDLVRQVIKQVDIKVIVGCYCNCFEDVKKALYTGAILVTIPYIKVTNFEGIKQACDRFGKDKVVMEFDASADQLEKVLPREETIDYLKELGVAAILLKHVYVSDCIIEKIASLSLPVYIRDGLRRNDMETLIGMENVVGVATDYYDGKDIMKIKHMLKDAGIATDTFESSVSFAEFKKDEKGLVPVIVQDYKTNEVLMLAYMNEESFEQTIQTGKMTYFSRSRQSLWLKGETSGHFQYVKSLSLDCDKDTILAKVQQIGVACHTGEKSCFFRELVNKEQVDVNPYAVLSEVFGVISERKQCKKEGSYTNYLFDKGIDKILKKCGEEATEIVIAAKNPNKEELKYEIADFLYHMMVLMVEKGVDLDDIMYELAHRR